MPLSNILSAVSDQSWTPLSKEEIFEPFTYIAAQPGKGVRRDLLRAFNLWMNVPEGKLAIISSIVGNLHHASLMLDDIEDDSKLRRGRPVTHRIFGIPQTVNTATYVHCLAHQELCGLQSPHLEHGELVKILIDELICLHHGQGLDILWRDSAHCPTENEYIEMVKGKTGGLLRIGVRLMMACAVTNVESDYVPLINLLGVFYQIRDDLMNLRSSVYSASKGFAEDLEEGKFSFPIVHAVQTDPTSRQMLNVLQQRPTSPTLKTYTIDYMEHETNSFEYTLSILNGLECEIRKEIDNFGGNEALSKIIDVLHVGATDFL
ncbi:isoprenoid synthase domain-containing protein [Mycena vulgaris]|nr:isoprenoid synthase domain-containing protein [Mycena vulgaris]